MVGLCVCLLVKFVSPTKTVEAIKMPFGVLGQVSIRNHVLDEGQISLGKGHFCGVVCSIEKHLVPL